MIREFLYVDVAEREKNYAHTIGFALCTTPYKPTEEKNYDLWVRRKETTCRVCHNVIDAGELYIMAWPPQGKGQTLHCQRCFILRKLIRTNCKVYKQIINE